MTRRLSQTAEGRVLAGVSLWWVVADIPRHPRSSPATRQNDRPMIQDLHRMARRTTLAFGVHAPKCCRAERLGEDGTVLDCAWYSIVQDEWPAVKKRLEARRT